MGSTTESRSRKNMQPPLSKYVILQIMVPACITTVDYIQIEPHVSEWDALV